jgi:uracil phosphoribosyltransferase
VNLVIEDLLKHNVKEESITFVSMVAAPQVLFIFFFKKKIIL